MNKRIPWILGIVIGVVLETGILLGYFLLGLAPVATAADPMPFEKTLARAALHARLDREMSKEPAPAATDARLLDGADIYRVQCAVCHGTLGGKKTPIAAGMFPHVPQLFEHGVDDDEPAETYWKVANGIRLTGMPGFKGTLTDAQIWDVTLVLSKKTEALPAPVQAALRTDACASTAPVAPTPAPPAAAPPAP